MPHPDDAAASAQQAATPAEEAGRPFVLDDPLGWFDQARDSTPVLWHPRTSSWYVTRFDDVWNLLLDDRLGARSPDPFLRTLPAAQREAVRPLVDFLSRWPMFLDPPRHSAVRRVMRPAFTTAEVTRVAGVVHDSLRTHGALRTAPGTDLLDTLLRPSCRAALSALLGVAPDDFPRLVEWSERLMGFVGRSRIDAALVAAAEEALAQFTEFTGQTLAVEASPLARAVGAAVREGLLEPADAVAVYAQLVTGALEPTVTALATALAALCRGPEYRRGYRADPGGFVNEAVRLATPFHFAARRALCDLELRGQRIPAGARVVLVLAAANRDPQRFPDPLDFRWDRGGAHVAFGRGRHACLGALVAHHTIRPVLDAYVDGLPDPQPLDIRWHVTMGMRWPLDVTVRPADRPGPEASPNREAAR
ncbi:cytochrome P450 [Streptacidiphilus sp. PB12-B1b]|uniref:cytochrome P450 n=1 Tax=Streptacidiphilus sp. PB12-B1b TaxID=2705012 RepID=UPI0015FE126C|nr:cytochrome P450 [Streptacidiphilus sp. PB12-B1b]QMU78212.1 cytochrome P450 [Streptacidiphilus sp. PB12-B1b]